MIRNKPQLIENGKTQAIKKARLLALESLETALKAVDPKTIVKNKLSLNGSFLQVEKHSFDINKFNHVYVVGGGKAAGPMAEALEEILGNNIDEGTVNVPHGSLYKTKIIKFHGASHPLPDEASVEGTKQILNVVEKASEDDLVICLISGGGSSLMSLPREGVSLKEKRELTNALLRCGATIREINSVRKHLSGFKGGWLAKKTYPATILNIILSDVVGDPLDTIASGPTVPDETTFAEAKTVLEKYELWQHLPLSIQKIIEEGKKDRIQETPKSQDNVFDKVYNLVIGNNRTASFATFQYLKSQELNTVLLTSTIEGEARCVGALLASIAKEIFVSDNPLPKPAAVIVGGETTVKVSGNGLGGRNQEVALAAAIQLQNNLDCTVVVASLGTDGVDGPTDAAGAIVDVNTYARAVELGLKPEVFLAENDSHSFFSNLRDLIITGQTGTNVNDISLIIVL
jgi:glycerate 2-kinase